MTENKGDLISREALKVHISELMLVYSGSELDNAILNAIDNAPSINKTILKRRDVNKCLNCSYCCKASINSKGEVYIMCKLGAQCPTKEGE